jgi:outer membrane protein assembly factor BamB
LRDKFGHGQLLLVGDHLVVHSEFGNLGIFPASPDKPAWDIKIRTIKGLCWNTLALSGNKLIVRSDLEMACLELPIRSTNEVQK